METWTRARIYTDENHKVGHQAFHDWILHAALEFGLRGGTVLRAVAGFGGHHQIHASRVLRLSESLPLIVEILDEPESVKAFLASVGDQLENCLITFDSVSVRSGHQP